MYVCMYYVGRRSMRPFSILSLAGETKVYFCLKVGAWNVGAAVVPLWTRRLESFVSDLNIVFEAARSVSGI